MQGESLRRTANSSARKVSGLRPVSAIAVATYEKAALEQGTYEARRLRNYVSKLGQYLSKSEGGRRSFCVTRASASSTSLRGAVVFRV